MDYQIASTSLFILSGLQPYQEEESEHNWTAYDHNLKHLDYYNAKFSQRKRKLLLWIASRYPEQNEQCQGRGIKIHVSLNVNIVSWINNFKMANFSFSYVSIKCGLY